MHTCKSEYVNLKHTSFIPTEGAPIKYGLYDVHKMFIPSKAHAWHSRKFSPGYCYSLNCSNP